MRSILLSTGTLSRISEIAAAPGDYDRLFVVEQWVNSQGRIRILDPRTGALRAQPFLAVGPVSMTDQLGLLGLAFHPEYAANGYSYIAYTDLNTDLLVARYTVSANPDVAEPNSAWPVLRVPGTPYVRDIAGWLGFGPDGFLYVAIGDRDDYGDPGNHAQDPALLYGKVLRIDVNADDFPQDPERNYAVPPSNPFVGQAGYAPEIWARGLHDPIACSFDTLTGDLYIGDNGDLHYEEIDFQPAGSPGGLNYGWRCREGTWCTGYGGCNCNDPNLTMPIYAYAHQGNVKDVVGGHVYRGYAVCDLRGTYFLADYLGDRIWSFRYRGSQLTDFRDRTSELSPGGQIGAVTTWGRDASGELYMGTSGGDLWKIVPGAGVPPRGDMNRDGVTDLFDINPFVFALGDPAGYEALYGAPPNAAGDLNCDGRFDFSDITPFVHLLANL
ncbi:MAG: PQQ-dependent sugar dehydrogenase [Planctomycetota bacterium]